VQAVLFLMCFVKAGIAFANGTSRPEIAAFTSAREKGEF